MQLSERQKEEIRARLASRKSFFGDSLSNASASDSYISSAQVRAAEQAAKAEKDLKRQRDQARLSKGSVPNTQDLSHGAAPSRPTPIDYAAFSSLTDDQPQQKKSVSLPNPAQKPPRPGASSPSPGDRRPESNSQVRTSVGRPNYPQARDPNRPNSASQTLNGGGRGFSPALSPSKSAPTSQPSRSPSPGLLSSKAAAYGDFRAKSQGAGSFSMSRHSPPRRAQSLSSQTAFKKANIPIRGGNSRRTQKGEVSRRQAIAPQALGGATRSQKAAEAWALQMEKLRQESGRPSPSLSPSPPPTGPIAAGRMIPNAVQQSGSGAGRPLQKSSALLPENRRPSQDQRPGNSAKQAGTKGGPPSGLPPRSKGGLNERPSVQNGRTTNDRPASQKVNWAGKDLSRLPQWQREIIEKKMRAQMQQQKRGREESETEDDLDDFVVDDADGDWRSELKSITGYDPSKYKDERDDKSMEADWKSIQAEEKRSARLGRGEDEKAELEELARQREKAAKKKAKRSNTGFIL